MYSIGGILGSVIPGAGCYCVPHWTKIYICIYIYYIHTPFSKYAYDTSLHFLHITNRGKGKISYVQMNEMCRKSNILLITYISEILTFIQFYRDIETCTRIKVCC